MYCNKCSAEIEKGAKYCTSCGQAVKISGNSDAIASSSVSEQTSHDKLAVWKKVVLSSLGGIASIFLLLFGLGVYWGGQLVEPINTQLEAIKNRDLSAAYTQTAKAFKKATTEQNFEQFIRSYPVFLSHTDYSITHKEWDNNHGIVTVKVHTKQGAKISVEYKLVKENDQWKILNFKILPAEKN